MKKEIKAGIYLVINPAQNKEEILIKLNKVKDESIAAIQIWDNPEVEFIDEDLLQEIIQIFKDKVPVLINNKWRLLKRFEFDGIHFDNIPDDFDRIKKEINNNFIKGLTLENNLAAIKKAEELGFDYLSFCAMFPSQTSDDCEIVQLETVRKCREMTNMPIFLSGGITLENIKKLKDLSFHGIAVVSGIMKAVEPQKVIKQYESALKK